MFEFENYINNLLINDNYNNNINIVKHRDELKKLSTLKKPIKNYLHLNYILENFKYDDKILDYGSGNSILISLLHFLGYNSLFGVDVIINKKREFIFKICNFNENNFYLIEDSLPFNDKYFDLVISNTVIEHVFNVENYFSETSRVLKDDKKAYFIFPHRLRPYDSHTRTIFIHYFPKKLRKYLYDYFTKEGGNYYNNFLNLQYPGFYYKLSKRFFSSIENNTQERLLSSSIEIYDGNKNFRKFYQSLIKIPILGKIILNLSYKFTQLSIILTK